MIRAGIETTDPRTQISVGGEQRRLRKGENVLMPAAVKHQDRIPELTPRQLIGLRFASNAELPELVRRVFTGSLRDTTDIKKAVTHWQGDYLRA
jgi:hypothetical protein